MHRRDISKALFATAAGSAVAAQRAEAQTCTAPCYAQTAAEMAAINPATGNPPVVPVNFAYPPGNIRRYGAVANGTADDSVAIRTALNCVPLQGGAISCYPPGQIMVASTVYIPQRIGADLLPQQTPGYGIDLNFYGCEFIGQGVGVGTIFESGMGVTSSATNFGQPNESATSEHIGTTIRGARFSNYGIALKLFNFGQGCALIDLFSRTGTTMVYTLRCFYLAWQNVNVNVAGLASTDVVMNLNDLSNTMTFNNCHVASNGNGIGWQFNGSILGALLTGLGAEGLTIGYNFIGEILGVEFRGNYSEACATSVQLGSLSDGLNIEGNYFNSNTTVITGNNWISGRWGLNRYDTDGVRFNAVNLSGTGNLCEVWVPPRQYTTQGGNNPPSNWTLLPPHWSVSPGCKLRLQDYIYNDPVGYNAPIALLSSAAGAGGNVAKQYTGTINALHSGQVPFCHTTVSGTTVTVNTLIPFDADAGGIEFDMVIQDSVAVRHLSGRVFGGTSVFRYDTQAITVAVSNNSGFFRFVFAGFNIAAQLNGGEIRII